MSSARGGNPVDAPKPEEAPKPEDVAEGLADQVSLEQMPDIFSLRKPKDAKAGAASALKSVGKGFLAGAVSLVAAPLIGAKEGGAAGFAKGLGLGVLGAVVLPVTATCVATVQLTRGIINTPESIREDHRGKFWDEQTRCWVVYNPAEQIALEGGAASADAAGSSGAAVADGGGDDHAASKKPKSDALYTVLGLKHDATPGQIKKQYYKLAREKHPDKHPENPEASEEFQKLAHAYQVLSDVERRKQYDMHGDDAVDNSTIMKDASLFFTMLFGSDKFEHLIGELQMAILARLGGDTDIAFKREQAARVNTLVAKLEARLGTYIDTPTHFEEKAECEAISLREVDYGEVLLPAIGLVYESAAEAAMGGFTAIGASFKAFGRNMGNYYDVAKSAASVIQVQQKYEKRMKNASISGDAEKEAVGAAGDPESEKASGSKGSGDARAATAVASGSGVDAGRGHAESAGGGGSGGGGGSDASAPNVGQGAAAAGSAEARAETAKELEAEMAPMIMKAMSQANIIDVSHTLKEVCNRVLHGGAKYGLPPVPKELRKQRCAGLRLLGKIFQREGATAVKIAKGKEGEDESAKKANFEDYQERVQKAAENIARKRNEDQAKEEESRP